MSSSTAKQLPCDLAGYSDKVTCRPFVKWVGGKSQLIAQLRKRLPEKFGRYFEPFVGGGALLFRNQPSRAYVSDINPELINAYQVVKDEVEALIEDLKTHVYEEKYFYKVRNIDRSIEYKKWSRVQRASRLIFLNKTCFNGLYRVNSKGHFNTPFGRYVNPTIVDEGNLRACSAVLAEATISLSEFDQIEGIIERDDFVYFDPPYVPLSATANFTTYSSQGFDEQMQNKLFELCCSLDKRGIRFMLSNSSAPFVLELYRQFKVELVLASRAINSDASKRGNINEVIVTNY